ncbi:MAG: CpXC domain-containing protein [Anaerolineae bacterium]|nr:CpXC domain-containing protein [Anaerolineae bacterium]
MPPRYAAAVTCPSCGTRFQAPVQQVLDVRVEPDVTSRVLSGSVNVARCPSCGTGGALNLPFVYHDPAKEIALLYLPVDSGADMVARQKVAGQLTRQLLDAMPPEEKKGYLLQPETFISLETLVKRVLDLEGVSEEEMARSQSQREFVGTLLQAPQEQWPELVSENEALIDEGLFAFIEYVLQMTQAAPQAGSDAATIEALHEYLVQQTDIGRALAVRAETLRGFAEDPTGESLLAALIEAADDETIGVLVRSGMPLMDYGFFQQLVGRIEEASDEESSALRVLRRKILDARDEIVAAGEANVRDRSVLLGKLLSTKDAVRMAGSHLSELDDLFFTVLGAQLQEAQQRNDQQAVADLQRVATAVNQVMESTMPPEMALTRRLMAAPSDEVLMEQLQAIRQLLTPRFLQFLESLEGSMREQGQEEGADRLMQIRAKAQQVAPGGAPQVAPQTAPANAPPAPPAESVQRSADGQERTPSGLIIARR